VYFVSNFFLLEIYNTHDITSSNFTYLLTYLVS